MHNFQYTNTIHQTAQKRYLKQKKFVASFSRQLNGRINTFGTAKIPQAQQ